jgi:hypothetical protein
VTALNLIRCQPNQILEFRREGRRARGSKLANLIQEANQVRGSGRFLGRRQPP